MTRSLHIGLLVTAVFAASAAMAQQPLARVNFPLEAARELNQGVAPGTIALHGLTAGVSACELPAILINAGMPAQVAVSAVLAAAGNAQAVCVVRSAFSAAPGQGDQIARSAILAGADPTLVLPATAAGPQAGGTLGPTPAAGQGTFVSPPSLGGGGGGRGTASTN